MAKVDLSSSEWCDLIFSGKNKAYGAYQLREKSPKRHNIAVILVIVIALIGFSIPTLMTGAVNLIELFSAGGGGATGSTLFISSCLISGSV